MTIWAYLDPEGHYEHDEGCPALQAGWDYTSCGQCGATSYQESCARWVRHSDPILRAHFLLLDGDSD